MTKRFMGTMALFLSVLFIASPPSPVSAGDEGKLRIAVLDFENKVPDAQAEIGFGLAEMLISELKKRGQYTVLERASLVDILGEQDFTQSGRVQRGQQVKIGRVKGAQLLIKGALTEFSFNVKNRNIGIGYKGFGFGITEGRARVACDIRLIDAMTGEIIKSIDEAAEIKSSGAEFAGTVKGFSFGAGGSENHPLGQASRQLIDRIVSRITASLDTSTVEALTASKFEARIVKIDGPQRIVINRGSSDGVKVGEQFNVHRIVEELTDPETGELLGQDKVTVGRIEITKVEDRWAEGKVVYGEGFDRNDLVTR